MLPARQRQTTRALAFTLVELLVVIAIIGILVALLLPAVQSAREASRRTSCLNNHKQVALAMHNHHDTKGRFPHGVYNYIDDTNTNTVYGKYGRRCWFHDLMPFIEAGNIGTEFENFSHTNNGDALSFPLRKSSISAYWCPSDPNAPKVETFADRANQGFSGNIVTNAGNDYFRRSANTDSAKLNGVFFGQSKIRLADITDGSSHTAFVSEIIMTPDTNGHDIRGRYYNPAHSGVAFSTRLPPNTAVADRFNWCKETIRQAPCVYTATDMFVLARSYHTGGVNIATADGAVTFLRSNIDPVIFRAMGSRSEGEAVSSF